MIFKTNTFIDKKTMMIKSIFEINLFKDYLVIIKKKILIIYLEQQDSHSLQCLEGVEATI